MPARLWFTMITATALTIAITTLGILLLMELIGGFSLIFALIIAVIFTIAQWLIAPKIISLMFKLEPAEKAGYAWLVDYVNEIAKKSGMKKPPKVYVSPSPIANAFAFGNIFTGKKVAVTTGLINTLSPEEIKAVLGHELGHIKHKDVEIMMALSVLPAIFYLIGRWAYYAGFFRGVYGGSSRDSSDSRLALFAIAVFSLFMYFILSLFMLWVSRTREYYADYHSAEKVDEGALYLSTALAKLEYINSQVVRETGFSKSALAFKQLMISNPESRVEPVYATNVKEYVYFLAHKKITFGERIKEIFSTHPLTPKRIRNLFKIGKIKL